MLEPKISIIIPAYNVEKYIHKCLDSILEQTFNDYEIIIVNDVSTDNTKNIIEEYRKLNSKIIYIELKKNSGSALARQQGLDIARGKYVTFIDADDWLSNRYALETIEDNMSKYNVDCLIFQYRTIHKKNFKLYKKIPIKIGKYSNTDIATNKIKNDSPSWHYLWNKCYKLDTIRSNNIKFIPELRRAQDVRFNKDFFKVANEFYIVKDYLYDYNCTNDNSVTKKIVCKNIKTEIEFWENITNEYLKLVEDYKYLGIYNLNEKYLNKWLYNKYLYILLNNKQYEWYEELKLLLEKDNNLIHCSAMLGYKKIYINLKVKLSFTLNKMKKSLKNVVAR